MDMKAKKKNTKSLHPGGEKPDLSTLSIEALTLYIAENPDNAELYYHRAEAHFQNNSPGKAINDYKKVLDLDPGNQKAAAKVEFIRTILRFQNTDIYANPNTNMDPWLE